MTKITGWLQEILGFSQDFQIKLLASFTAIILLWLGRKIVLKIIYKNKKDVRLRYRWRKVSAYVAFGIGLFLVGRLWFEGFQSISCILTIVLFII